MNQPLLSVIVPCYNVEKYLDKCVSSIIAQTYSNFEILLVNDGSTDDTGVICDLWQEKDRRIRVIHKENEGSSCARKTGIENAKSEYLSFIDSDDWIDADMYTGMMAALLDTGSDIAQCGHCTVYEDGIIEHWDNHQYSGSFEVMDRVGGVLLILEDNKWRSWMCNKIFKKHLFNDVVFHKGRGFADDFVTLFAFHHANQTVYIHNDYYYYLQRSGSITKAQNIPVEMKNQRDYYDAYYERYSFVNRHPEYRGGLPHVIFMTTSLGINLLRSMIVFPEYFTDEYFDEKVEQLRSIPLYILHACFVFIRKSIRFTSYKKAASLAYCHIFGDGSTSSELSLPRTHNVNYFSRRKKIKLVINLFVFKMCPPKCYKYLMLCYVRFLRFTNHLKITKLPIYESLADFYSW